MKYSVATEPSERGIGDWLTVWTGAFASDFEGQGIARPGARRITISLEMRGQVVVYLPKGVTFPRTDANYAVIDATINEAILAYERERRPWAPDLPSGDDGKPTELPDPPAPGADDE